MKNANYDPDRFFAVSLIKSNYKELIEIVMKLNACKRFLKLKKTKEYADKVDKLTTQALECMNSIYKWSILLGLNWDMIIRSAIKKAT